MSSEFEKLWDFMCDQLPEDELIRRMKTASGWMTVWPEVFRHGRPTDKWTRTRRKAANGEKAWKETLFLTNGLGETRKYIGDDIPSGVPRPWNEETEDG